MFGIHGHSLHLLARPIKGHASFKSWQPCADNQSGEWGDLAAEISFAIQSRSDLSRALSVQFDTHRKTSLLASLVQLWAVSPTDLHFPDLSFPFIPVLSFYVNSIRSLTLTTFRDIFLGSSKALEYIVAAPWRADAPTDTKVWPIRKHHCVLHEINCYFIWKTTMEDIWLVIHVMSAPMCLHFEVFLQMSNFQWEYQPIRWLLLL